MLINFHVTEINFYLFKINSNVLSLFGKIKKNASSKEDTFRKSDMVILFTIT